MTRSFIVSLLAGIGLFGAGCAQHAGGIVASAPSSKLVGRIPSTGRYTLYKVTRFNVAGKPMDTIEVASYDLQEGERVGFQWLVNPETVNHPNAEAELVAFAGNNRENLGPITSRQEKYFWANAMGWSQHWPAETANGFARRMTLQD